jgi:hypothetical protein
MILTDIDFTNSVFINCPFDKDYEPILQAILFCILCLGKTPRLATERQDGGENRLDKIRGLIEASKYSIHDLSRCQAKRKGEHFRLNMPFELGIDYGCRQYFGSGREAKKFLILEEKKYRFQAAISDISGSDIEAHGADHRKAVACVRNWLVSEAGVASIGAAKILAEYGDFQEWYWEKKLGEGASEEEIREYPTSELVASIKEWIALGKPL